MDQSTLDTLARALALAPSRRRLLRRLGAATIAAASAVVLRQTAAQEAGDDEMVQLASLPCACSGDRCQRCLIGLTGGGVVGTAAGDAQLVLFASRLEVDSGDPAAGFVRWVILGEGESALTLESVGPIAYGPVEGDESAREVRGTMTRNGEGEYPFMLRAVDFGAAAIGQDTALIQVGNRLAEGGDFGYEGKGTLVGGDLQLLDTVAPISAP